MNNLKGSPFCELTVWACIFIHGVKEYNANGIITDSFSKDQAEKFRLLLIVNDGDRSHNVRAAEKRAHQQNLHHGQLEVLVLASLRIVKL